MTITTTTNPVLRHHRLAPSGALALLLAAVTACGSAVQPPGEVTASASQELRANNGIAPNGLVKNGLVKNGLVKNGLTTNGLVKNGLSTSAFATWFDADAPTSDMVMSYVVRCAYSAGNTLSWTSPTTRASYTWAGALGLLPGWASGKAMTTAEEQVLTACLAAHVNAYGVHVTVAIEGRGATGVQIPIGPTELTDYPLREAAWFGNLVQGQGIFFCIDHPNISASDSSARACAIDKQQKGTVSVPCPPLVMAGTCASVCLPDATKTFYESCTYNGVTYKPLTTRLATSSMFTCGDGTCQFTESCGTGTAYDSCLADCGLCP